MTRATYWLYVCILTATSVLASALVLPGLGKRSVIVTHWSVHGANGFATGAAGAFFLPASAAALALLGELLALACTRRYSAESVMLIRIAFAAVVYLVLGTHVIGIRRAVHPGDPVVGSFLLVTAGAAASVCGWVIAHRAPRRDRLGAASGLFLLSGSLGAMGGVGSGWKLLVPGVLAVVGVVVFLVGMKTRLPVARS